MAGMEFLRPRLHGARFDGGEIPLEVLGDLVALLEMVLEVAKWRFLEENPERRRVPRGFTESVTLKLAGLEEGSAVAVITISSSRPTLDRYPLPYQDTFEQAREYIADTISAAEENSQPELNIRLPRNHLAYFDRIGRSLRDGEYMELPTPRRSAPARLTKESRLRLVEISRIREFTETITLRGSVSEMDQDEMTFDLQPVYGRKVAGPIPEQHLDTIMEAFNGYRDGVRVAVYGIGRFNQQNRLLRLESVEHVDLLDTLDVPARLDELRAMNDGWLDGDGIAPPNIGLDWLSDAFNRRYPDTAPLPRIYPTEEGCVRMEWSQQANAIIVEVDLNTHTGYWLWFDRNSDDYDERQLNLEDTATWEWMASETTGKAS